MMRVTIKTWDQMLADNPLAKEVMENGALHIEPNTDGDSYFVLGMEKEFSTHPNRETFCFRHAGRLLAMCDEKVAVSWSISPYMIDKILVE